MPYWVTARMLVSSSHEDEEDHRAPRQGPFATSAGTHGAGGLGYHPPRARAGCGQRRVRKNPGAARQGAHVGRSGRSPRRPSVIAIDSSSFIAYLDGSSGPDVEATEVALAHRQAALPPAVLTELL